MKQALIPFAVVAVVLAALVQGVRLNRRIARQSPLARIIDHEITPSTEAQSDDEISDFIRGHCTTLYHAAGTCRMGTGPDAVVDPTLRVHGIANLRIADASVFPMMVSGNTNAPTIMVAEKRAMAMGT